MKNAEEYFKALKEDSQLAAEFQTWMMDSNCEKEEEMFEAARRFAAEKGFEVSVQEFAERRTTALELSDDDLEEVSGGGFRSRLTHSLKVFLVNYIPIIKI